jgi:hypothetical protein
MNAHQDRRNTMIRKLVLLVALLLLSAVTSAGAKTIIWVAMNWNADGTGTVNDDWQPWIDGLTAAGYTVDVRPGYWGDSTSPYIYLDANKVKELNAADLVIVSRALQSGYFGGTSGSALTATQCWNSVTTPILLNSPYVLRKSRWNWMSDDTAMQGANSGDMGSPLMQVVAPSHPIFYGLTLDANNQLKVADPCLCSGQCSFHPLDLGTATVLGNGTVIAKTVPMVAAVTTSGGSTYQVKNYPWIVEWQKGAEYYAGSGNVAASHRLHFSAGAHESAVVGVNAGAANKASGYNLTPDGWKLWLNAVKYMIGDPIAPPSFAAYPSPSDAQTDVLVTSVLSWTAGNTAQSHDVYMGTDLNSVTNATRSNPLGVLVKQASSATTFAPTGKLAYSTTYYWRIDEVIGSTPAKGLIWSFITEPQSYALAGASITATASSQNSTGEGPINTINGSGMTSDVADVNNMAMWLSVKGGKLPAWIQYDFDKVYRLDQMWVWNHNTTYEDQLGYGADQVTITYTSDGSTWQPLGNFEFNQGVSMDGYAHNTTIPFTGVAAKSVRITITSSWQHPSQTGLSEVRFYYVPTYAREPQPATASVSINPTTTSLSWKPGREAVSHSIFLGTDANAVKAGAVASVASTAAKYTPAGLELGTTYYWRVDEVNNAASPKTWTGDVWSFSTPDYFVVDDMESYTDAKPNRVFDVWADGYDTPSNNGSVVGLGQSANGTFCDGTTFHGGKVSMPFAYGQSSASLSEATRTFATPQDWTVAGAKTLVLFFQGVTTNVPGQLYVKINSTKVNYSGNSAGLATILWKQWNVDLSAFSAADLKAVKTLTLGITGSGAKGTLYFDDLRLYRAASATVTPVDPGTNSLVSYCDMEGGRVADSVSGVAGVLTDMTFASSTGALNQAAKFNGSTSFVDLGLDFWTKVMSKLSSSTFAVWVNYAGSNNWARTLALGTGVNANVLLIPSTATAGIVRFQVKTNVPNDGLTGTGYVTGYVESATAISVGWHHLAGVVDAAPAGFTYPVLYIYVDGVLAGGPVAGKLPKDIDVVAGTAPQMWLGKSHNSSDPFFNGSMDELRIYNRVLSAAEIRYLAGDR